MKNLIKNILYFFQLLMPAPQNKAVVLMYHSVGDNDLYFSVPTEEFRRQMKYLAEQRYNIVSLDQLNEYLDRKEIPSRTVVVTFDDGYKDNFTNAFPILKEFKIPAAIFLATGTVAGSKDIYDNQPISPIEFMDWAEVIELEKSDLIDIEPHTAAHPKLAQLNAEAAKKEIVDSKDEIEKRLNKTCHYFSYPYGSFNNETDKIVRELGLQIAFTVASGLVSATDDKFKLSRNAIDTTVNFFRFKSIVKWGRI